MILILFFLVSSIAELSFRPLSYPLFLSLKNFLNNLIFNYSMFIVLLILLLKKTRICNPSSTKTAAHFLSVMTAYYSMIAQTSSLKANPSLAFDNMAVLKNTGLLLL